MADGVFPDNPTEFLNKPGYPNIAQYPPPSGGISKTLMAGVKNLYGNGSGESGGGGESESGSNNMSAWGDYLGWQRKNVEKLIKQYRDMFPAFLRGWKEDSYKDLDDATHDYGEASMVNLWKRGLGKSPAWQAGSQLDTASFQEGGARDIESYGQQMEMDTIAKLAAAVGRPDAGYANSANAWNSVQGMQNAQMQAQWQAQIAQKAYIDEYLKGGRGMTVSGPGIP